MRWGGRGFFGRRAGGRLERWVRSWTINFRAISAPDCVHFFCMERSNNKQNRTYLYDHTDPGSGGFHQCATGGHGTMENLPWYEVLDDSFEVVDTVANSVSGLIPAL